MQKYGFRIRTRNGLVVENLQVIAADRPAAEERIRQIYHHCEILECDDVKPAAPREEGIDLEGAVNLISREDPADKP